MLICIFTLLSGCCGKVPSKNSSELNKKIENIRKNHKETNLEGNIERMRKGEF